MPKLTELQIKNRLAKVLDDTAPLSARKLAHKEVMDEVMNPDPLFDPTTFDPKRGTRGYEAKRRDRKAPPLRLPTMGMHPKEILEGQMVGMFESKQDLYLIMAYYVNMLLDRIEELEKKVP